MRAKSLFHYKTSVETLLPLFFNIGFLDHPVLTQLKLKTKFVDWNDTTEQVWEPKWVIPKFRDYDDIAELVWEP